MGSITIQLVDGPVGVERYVQYGPFILHRAIVKDGLHPEHWSVTLPQDGRTAGHFPNFWLASKAATYLIEIGVDWTLSWEAIEQAMRQGGLQPAVVSSTLQEVFGARYRYHKRELETEENDELQ